MRVDESGASVLTDELVDETLVEQAWHYVLGRRRGVLVDRAYQLRVALFNVAFMGALLAPILASYYFALTAETSISQVAPELKGFFAAQDVAQFRLILAASVVFLVGLFLVTIFETHRTAGAAYALRRQLEAVARGKLGGKLTLRKQDNLAGIQSAFNEMLETLRDRARAEASALETMADDLERCASGGSAREASGRLRLLAEQKRAAL
jgi:methyl-accepting chemotaxis protein